MQTMNFFAGDFISPVPAPEMNFDSSPSVSDCESGVTGNSSSSTSSASSFLRRSSRRKLFDDTIAVQVSEDERAYEVIARRFLSAMVENTEVVAIHRRNWSGDDFFARARVQSFQLHAKALAFKNDGGCGGGDGGGGSRPNDKLGWYGGSFERINQILKRGFSFLDLQETNNNGVISLSSDHSPSQSVERSIPDEQGVRHVLICRVLLGRSELIKDPNSTQIEPSSNEFDSGVDDYENPTKYIIWSSNMNSHILPEYIVSFTTPSMPGKSRMQKGVRVPTSPWISFPALISVLGKFLNSDAICLISKYHKQYKERRITRAELIKIVRQIAGDKLLITVIKSCKGAKELKMPFGFLRNRNTNK